VADLDYSAIFNQRGSAVLPEMLTQKAFFLADRDVLRSSRLANSLPSLPVLAGPADPVLSSASEGIENHR